jgi:hypothetical protein
MVKLAERRTPSGLHLSMGETVTRRGSWGCLTALVLVTFVPLLGVVAWAMLAAGEDRGLFDRMPFFVFLVTGLLALVGLVVLAMRTPVEMELRRDLDLWVTTTASAQSIWPRTRSFRLSDADRIEVERGMQRPDAAEVKGERPPGARFTLTVLDQGGNELDHWPLEVESVDTSPEILAFFLRLAGTAGLSGLRVARNDDLQLEASAHRHLHADMMRVDTAVREQAPAAATRRPAEAAAVIPAFDPQSIPEDLDLAASTWEPGSSVVLTRPFRMHRLSGLSYSALALLVGALLWRFADLAGTYGAERLRGSVLSLLLALAGLAVVVNLPIAAFALSNGSAPARAHPAGDAR